MAQKEACCIKSNTVETPITGLNDNLEFMGKLLHVQTEKIVFPTPHIATQVFSSGRILASKKSDIPLNLQTSHELDEIKELMRQQHAQTIREISDKQKRLLESRHTPEPR
jgi:hypothetical protein